MVYTEMPASPMSVPFLHQQPRRMNSIPPSDSSGSRAMFALPLSSSRRIFYSWTSADKPRSFLPFIVSWFLALFVSVTFWEADLRAQLAASAVGVAQTRVRSGFQNSKISLQHHEPESIAVDKRILQMVPGNTTGLQEDLIQGGERSNSIMMGAPHDSRPIFVPEDVNNPTKIPVPPNGFPPPKLPSTHRNAKLLQRIRKMSTLSPRWPKHPGMHAIELRSYGPAYSSIVVSHKLKVIYVPVFKVGTTSMMWNIAYLENNPHIMNQTLSAPGSRDFFLHEMGGPAWRDHAIFKKSQKEIRRLFEDPEYMKFGFVRNPFDRIISAYLDKIVQFGIVSTEYQKQMYGLYGDDPIMRRLRNETKPTFKEYLTGIEQVLKLPRTNSTNFWEEGSFEENSSRRDLHWRPQVELLHPDLVHFDFVGRFESLEKDRAVVLEWMYRHTDRRMPNLNQKKLHSTNPLDKVQLYNELSNDQELRDMVFKIYEQDFNLFQFSKTVPRILT